MSFKPVVFCLRAWSQSQFKPNNYVREHISASSSTTETSSHADRLLIHWPKMKEQCFFIDT